MNHQTIYQKKIYSTLNLNLFSKVLQCDKLKENLQYMKKIKHTDSVFTMSKNHSPVLNIHSGESVVFETLDCYNNQINSENQIFNDIDMELNNPATGPLYIEDAEIGDMLKISIINIDVNDYGVMVIEPNEGVLGHVFNEAKIKIINIENNYAIFNDKVQIPIDPMIGVIGVAPSNEEIKNMVPCVHGGNMDCKRIKKGSTLYLPVLAKGALLSIGDIHAVMADGEIAICGLEINGEVTIKVEVIKNKEFPLPIVVDENHLITIVSDNTVDEASKKATINMYEFLINELNIPDYEAAMLLSLVGNLRICQIVDPKMTVRMEMPLSIFENYNYTMV